MSGIDSDRDVALNGHLLPRNMIQTKVHRQVWTGTRYTLRKLGFVLPRKLIFLRFRWRNSFQFPAPPAGFEVSMEK